MWLKILGGVATLVGVMLIFNARVIINNSFKNMGDENTSVTGLKALGTIIFVLGAIMCVI